MKEQNPSIYTYIGLFNKAKKIKQKPIVKVMVYFRDPNTTHLIKICIPKISIINDLMK